MAEKVCRVCKKDVANTKRIKDPQGNYYCATCHEATLNRKPTGTSAPALASSSVAPAEDDLLLAPETPVVKEATNAIPLPELCPNCGMKVFPNRKFCVKCNRDVTQMQDVIAMKAEAALGPGKDELFAIWFGRVLRVAMWSVIVVILAFILWGIYYRFHPVDQWDAYPKTREGAVREFLQDIAAGTDKGYDKAFLLISFRERATGQGAEDAKYETVLAKMHDEFVQKYGADWLSKLKLENTGPNIQNADDETDFRLTLGSDTYTIATQAQISVTAAAANMTMPRLKRPVFNEDHDIRFGILEVAEYKVHATHHMNDLVGPS